MEKQQQKTNKIGIGKFLAWNSRGISLNIQVVLISFIILYCTDVLGINAALAGTIIMASKLFDGVTDLFAGFIVDRTNTKIGRGRPYEIAIVGTWLSTWALFSVPAQYSTTAKCVWIFIAYTCAQSIFATLLNANETVYMVRAFKSQEHYITLSSLGGLVTVIGVVIFNVAFPKMIANAGTDLNQWSRMVLMLAIPLAIIGLMRFIFIKEEYDVDGQGSNQVNFKQVVELLKHNKYIYFVALLSLVYNLVMGLGVAVYYYKYIVNNIEIMGLFSLLSVASMLTMVFYGPILKKINTRQLIQIGCAIYVVSGLILFIAKDNLVLIAISTVLSGIGTLPIAFLAKLFIIDCADYNEWSGRPRMEGTLGSVNGFATKIGSALGTFLCGGLLALADYNGTAEIQPESALLMIRIIQSLLPAALYLIVGLLLFKYGLDKQMPQIREENEARRAVAKNTSET